MKQPPDSGRHAGVAAAMVEHLGAEARKACVIDVRLGLGYTALLLEDGRAGVAYTFRDLAGEGCEVFSGLRPLAGRPASALLPLLESSDAIEAAVGLACANALANREDVDRLDGDVLEHLDLRPDDHVGMVGHFAPLVAPLRARVRTLTIFERGSDPGGMLRPQHEALETLPRCQVALITATSILNGTIDDLLIAARDCREVVLLGASTPLLPEVLGPRNVTMLSGVVVSGTQRILQVVSEGGGMRQFGPSVRKITVRAVNHTQIR